MSITTITIEVRSSQPLSGRQRDDLINALVAQVEDADGVEGFGYIVTTKEA